MAVQLRYELERRGRVDVAGSGDGLSCQALDYPTVPKEPNPAPHVPTPTMVQSSTMVDVSSPAPIMLSH